MTREEIKNKLFDIILKNSSPTMVVKRTIDYQQTMVIVEEFINHETDLLNEFVEWQAKQYKDLYYKYDKEMKEVKDDTDYFWCSGRVAGIGEIRKRLKKDLEKFLETKDEKQSP